MTQKGYVVSGLIGSAVMGAIKAFAGMIFQWITGKQLVEAQTEAKAKDGAMQSVGEGKAVENVTANIADERTEPINPYKGQKWPHPDGKVRVFDGTAWVLESEYAKDDSDFFGDGDFNRPP